MSDFTRLPKDEQRHELAALEHALGLKRELYRRQHGEDAMPEVNGGGTLKTPFGSYAWRGYAGLMGLVVVILTLALGGVLYLVRDGQARTEQLITSGAAARAAQTKQMSDEHREISDGLEAVIYVLTLTEQQKARLSLERPRKIRELEGRR